MKKDKYLIFDRLERNCFEKFQTRSFNRTSTLNRVMRVVETKMSYCDDQNKFGFDAMTS